MEEINAFSIRESQGREGIPSFNAKIRSGRNRKSFGVLRVFAVLLSATGKERGPDTRAEQSDSFGNRERERKERLKTD